MMVSGVVRNDNHAAPASRAGLPQVFKERMERHGVEPFTLSMKNQFSIAQTNRSKVPHALTRGMMQQYRVRLLRGHPHQTTRSILLKMDFIGCPQIDFWVGHESPEFFYMPPEAQDQPGRSEGAGFCGDKQQNNDNNCL